MESTGKRNDEIFETAVKAACTYHVPNALGVLFPQSQIPNFKFSSGESLEQFARQQNNPCLPVISFLKNHPNAPSDTIIQNEIPVDLGRNDPEYQERVKENPILQTDMGAIYGYKAYQRWKSSTSQFKSATFDAESRIETERAEENLRLEKENLRQQLKQERLSTFLAKSGPKVSSLSSGQSETLGEPEKEVTQERKFELIGKGKIEEKESPEIISTSSRDIEIPKILVEQILDAIKLYEKENPKKQKDSIKERGNNKRESIIPVGTDHEDVTQIVFMMLINYIWGEFHQTQYDLLDSSKAALLKFTNEKIDVLIFLKSQKIHGFSNLVSFIELKRNISRQFAEVIVIILPSSLFSSFFFSSLLP